MYFDISVFRPFFAFPLFSPTARGLCPRDDPRGRQSFFSDFLRPFLEAGSSFSPNLLVDPGVGSNFFGIFLLLSNFVDLGVGNSFSCFLRSTFGVVRIFSSFRAVVFGPGPGADVRTQDPKCYVACSKYSLLP